MNKFKENINSWLSVNFRIPFFNPHTSSGRVLVCFMRNRMLQIMFLIPIMIMGQNIPELNPSRLEYVSFDFSDEFIAKFNSDESWKKCKVVWDKMSAEGRNYRQATKSELTILKYCDEMREKPWEVIGGGCSWYCGGGMDINTASSELKTQKGFNYKAENIHDLNYKTAWIEGVKGYGIGEYIVYDFPAENPRITSIIVVNGYVKNQISWRDNSRVKKLKVYINNIEFAILNLKDTKEEQVFEFEPIGNADRNDLEKLTKRERWTLKFEIMDIYKGDKYDDTAISEIYFDGIDVH